MAINHLEVLKHNLKTQNEQGEALIKVIERVEKIESNMNEKYTEVKDIVDEVRNRVTIEYEDQQVLRSIVGKKSGKIARDYWGDSKKYGAEIREMKGYATRHHWRQLKDYFRVTRYTSIRHVDFEKAKEFVRNVKLDKSFIAEYEEWRYQRIKKKQREQKMLENEKGLV